MIIRSSLLSAALILSCLLNGLAQTRVETLMLGTTPVDIELFESGKGGPCWLILHGSEPTATRSVRAVLQDSAGALYRIKNKLDRYLSYSCQNQPMCIDPNRIFTRQGQEKVLWQMNAVDSLCVTELDSFAQQFLNLLPDSCPILSVHSNTDGAYSIYSYRHELRQAADSVYVAPKHDPDDFYFVTTHQAYVYFRSKGYSVILQNNPPKLDDGSLSVYMANRGRPLITIECQTGHVTEQIRMLREIYSYLRQTTNSTHEDPP